MAVNVNKVFVAGRLVRDPELKSAKSGTSLCNFTLAVNRPPRKGGSQETDFLEVECWGPTADATARFQRKGSSVLVEGHITQSRWKGPDGSSRSRIRVTAERVYFLGGKDGPPSDEPPSDGPPPETEQCPY